MGVAASSDPTTIVAQIIQGEAVKSEQYTLPIGQIEDQTLLVERLEQLPQKAQNRDARRHNRAPCPNRPVYRGRARQFNANPARRTERTEQLRRAASSRPMKFASENLGNSRGLVA